MLYVDNVPLSSSPPKEPKKHEFLMHWVPAFDFLSFNLASAGSLGCSRMFSYLGKRRRRRNGGKKTNIEGGSWRQTADGREKRDVWLHDVDS